MRSETAVVYKMKQGWHRKSQNGTKEGKMRQVRTGRGRKGQDRTEKVRMGQERSGWDR